MKTGLRLNMWGIYKYTGYIYARMNIVIASVWTINERNESLCGGSRTKCHRTKCHGQNVVDKMSWSKCRGWNVVVKMSWSKCRDQNVAVKMSWSKCRGWNVVVKISWSKCRGLYLCGICQLIPMKLWPNTAQGCNHQSVCLAQVQPLCSAALLPTTQSTTSKGCRLG